MDPARVPGLGGEREDHPRVAGGRAGRRANALEDEVDGQQDTEEAEERRETLVEPGVASRGAVGVGERPEEGPVLARRDEDREGPGEDEADADRVREGRESGRMRLGAELRGGDPEEEAEAGDEESEGHDGQPRPDPREEGPLGREEDAGVAHAVESTRARRLRPSGPMVRLLIVSGRLLELVSRVHLRWKRRVARDLAPYGVTQKQVFVLRKLVEAGSLAPSEVAELVFADRPTTTSMLATMERAGWITRRRDPENGKRVIVEITAAGRKKLASVPARLWRTGKTTVDPEAGLSAAERAEAIRLLEKLNAWLGQAEDR